MNTMVYPNILLHAIFFFRFKIHLIVIHFYFVLKRTFLYDIIHRSIYNIEQNTLIIFYNNCIKHE